MGRIYEIPQIGDYAFNTNGFTTLDNFDTDQIVVFNRLWSTGLFISRYDSYGCSMPGMYYGCYVSGDYYYSGTSCSQDGIFYYSSENTVYLDQYRVAHESRSTGISISQYGRPTAWLPDNIEPYTSYDALYQALSGTTQIPITYIPTNCTLYGPSSAVVGSNVYVSVLFSDGYGLLSPSDIYVTYNGAIVESTYSGGILSFTVPTPTE